MGAMKRSMLWLAVAIGMACRFKTASAPTPAVSAVASRNPDHAEFCDEIRDYCGYYLQGECVSKR
jgi:hypothetical protein